MAYPHDPNQPPYGHQSPQYGPPQGQPPAPYGPPPGYGYQQPMPQQVQQVGRSVTKPAWTCGEIALVVCTAGFGYPWVWARRRRRTTITRHQ
jgi:hypothetical protein